ncbi:MAG: hypothetical protein AABN33_19955 [Acidobacteriota bacterium]
MVRIPKGDELEPRRQPSYRFDSVISKLLDLAVGKTSPLGAQASLPASSSATASRQGCLRSQGQVFPTASLWDKLITGSRLVD